MLLHKSFAYYLSLFGAALAAVSSIPEVSARIVGPADIHESIKQSKSFPKDKGEECIKLETNNSKNMKEDSENDDVRVLGCGEALICLEDESSSTGARCVDSVEVHERDKCAGPGALCSFRDDWSRDLITFECCEGTTCGYVREDSTFLKVCH